MNLTIGGITVPHAAILAPMSGVTDMPFRRAVRRTGGGLVVTEMVASAAILREVRQRVERDTALHVFPLTYRENMMRTSPHTSGHT